MSATLRLIRRECRPQPRQHLPWVQLPKQPVPRQLAPRTQSPRLRLLLPLPRARALAWATCSRRPRPYRKQATNSRTSRCAATSLSSSTCPTMTVNASAAAASAAAMAVLTRHRRCAAARRCLAPPPSASRCCLARSRGMPPLEQALRGLPSHRLRAGAPRSARSGVGRACVGHAEARLRRWRHGCARRRCRPPRPAATTAARRQCDPRSLSLRLLLHGRLWAHGRRLETAAATTGRRSRTSCLVATRTRWRWR
mmetsp:Transcript_38155/g.113044  ORF Transcript_38155/g.113044 Transcript_38155/m.113044 type:complete len:254 (-) Transcript_38155:137-898(-)